MVELVSVQNDTAATATGIHAAISPRFALLATSAVVWGVLEHALRRQRIVAVFGDPGTSKTHTALMFTRENGAVLYVLAGKTVANKQPVLVEIAEVLLEGNRHPITGGFPHDLQLQYLDDELRKSRSNVGFLERRLRAALKAHVELLIVDEAHDLADDAADMIRGFHDRLGIGVALLANETFPLRFKHVQGKARFAQLSSRIDRREHLAGLLPEDYDTFFDHHRVRGRRARDLIRRHAERDGNLRRAAFIVDQARHTTPEGPLDLPHIAAAIDELGLFE